MRISTILFVFYLAAPVVAQTAQPVVSSSDPQYVIVDPPDSRSQTGSGGMTAPMAGGGAAKRLLSAYSTGTIYVSLGANTNSCPAGSTRPTQAECNHAAASTSNSCAATNTDCAELTAMLQGWQNAASGLQSFGQQAVSQSTATIWNGGGANPIGCYMTSSSDHGGNYNGFIYFSTNPTGSSSNPAAPLCMAPPPSSPPPPLSPEPLPPPPVPPPPAAPPPTGLHLTGANPKIVFGHNQECTLQFVNGALVSSCPIIAPPPPPSTPPL